MSGAQDLILGARVAHLRELKEELKRVHAENDALKAENEALKAHMGLALVALDDLRALPEGQTLEIWDGWNLILGAHKIASDRAALLAQARAELDADGKRRIWIVFDGHDERVVVNEPRLRVSYTGGTGAHRADRMIVDYLRLAAYAGLSSRVRVRTDDRDFLKQVKHFVTL